MSEPIEATVPLPPGVRPGQIWESTVGKPIRFEMTGLGLGDAPGGTVKHPYVARVWQRRYHAEVDVDA
jgi:hypothetical protein